VSNETAQWLPQSPGDDPTTSLTTRTVRLHSTPLLASRGPPLVGYVKEVVG